MLSLPVSFSPSLFALSDVSFNKRVKQDSTATQSMKNRDRDEIIRVVSTRYFNLPQKKEAQRSSRPPEYAFFSSESGGRSGARRGRGRNRGGGRSISRGGNSNGGCSHSSSSCASGNTGGSRGSSRGNNGTSSSGVAAAEVVVIRPPTAVGAAGGGATGERSAPQRRAISCPGALGPQILSTRRVPAHQTRRSW